MAVKKKKISELPLTETLEGLFTVGVDKLNKSVKVGLEFLKTSADRADSAADEAIRATAAAAEAATNADGAAAGAARATLAAETAATTADSAAEAAIQATNAAETAAQGATDATTALADEQNRINQQLTGLSGRVGECEGDITALESADVIRDERITFLEERVGLGVGMAYDKIMLADTGNKSFNDAIDAALNESIRRGGGYIIDCSAFNNDRHPEGVSITRTIDIRTPVKIRLPANTLRWEGCQDSMFRVTVMNGVTIEGYNRLPDKDYTYGATVLEMTAPVADHTPKYHIYAAGSRTLTIRSLTLRGVRSTIGRQFNNDTYPIDGCGGIFLEKEEPGVTRSGNTCNNIIIEDLLLVGTYAHAIYINTPILTEIRNVRISEGAGHGVFIEGGTSTMLINVYAASTQMAGFCLSGVTYCSLLNCVAENCSIGFWIRSSFNVSAFNPGVEQTITQGSNPWRLSQPVSGKYGFALTSPADPAYEIKDVSNDYRSQFIGHGFLITGGQNVNLYGPYAMGLANTIVTEPYPKGTEASKSVTYILVTGNCRQSTITNVGTKDSNGRGTKMMHDIRVDAQVKNLDLTYDLSASTILTGATQHTNISTDASVKGAICLLSQSSIIRSGNVFHNVTTKPIWTEPDPGTDPEPSLPGTITISADDPTGAWTLRVEDNLGATLYEGACTNSGVDVSVPAACVEAIVGSTAYPFRLLLTNSSTVDPKTYGAVLDRQEWEQLKQGSDITLTADYGI